MTRWLICAALFAGGCVPDSRYPSESEAVAAAREAIAGGAEVSGELDDGATLRLRTEDRLLVTLATSIGVPIGDLQMPYCVVLYEDSSASDVFAPCEEQDVELIERRLSEGRSIEEGAVESAPTIAPRPGDLRTWPNSWLRKLVEEQHQSDSLKQGLARCFAALAHEGTLTSIEAESTVPMGPNSVQTSLKIRIKPEEGPEVEEQAATTMRPGLDGETRHTVKCGGEDLESVPMHYGAVRGIGCDSVASAIWTSIEARALRHLPTASAGIRPRDPALHALYQADGEWYNPTGGAVTLNEADRVCVARLKAREDLMRQTTPLPPKLKPRLQSSVEVFRTLRRHGRTFPEGYRPVVPEDGPEGGPDLLLVDARCKEASPFNCPRLVLSCPAGDQACTAAKEG